MARRFEKRQVAALNLAFEESDRLTKQKKLELVADTGLDVEQVASWFNRKRARKRGIESRADLERNNVQLQQSLQESKEREAELQLELEKSNRREAELRAELKNLKHQLGIPVADPDIDPIRMFVEGYE